MMTTIETYTDSPPSRPTRRVALATVGLCAVLAGTLFVFARQWGWTLGRSGLSFQP